MVDLIFYFINLFILIFLGVFIFKRFFLASLKNGIMQDILYKSELKNKHKELIVAQKNLDETIADQELKYKSLKLKVDKWKEFFDKNKIYQQVQKEKLLQIYQEKILIQTEYHALHNLRKQVAPAVAQNLKHELELYFANENNAYKYLDNIINTFDKQSYK